MWPIYDNRSLDVNMNKLKPYQELEIAQAYALQSLACHILEAEVWAKQNIQ